MEVKHIIDTYKISQENSKSGREVGLACKNKWDWSWLEKNILLKILYRIIVEK